MSPYIRTVKTASGATAVQIVHSSRRGSRDIEPSGATAVQIVHSSRRGSRDIEHIGSAHTDVDVELLKTAAKQRLVVDQDPLDFGDGRPEGATLPITSTRAQHLWDLLGRGYAVLGFDKATGRDKVFRDLVLARLIEPTSKADSVRVIEEVGASAPGYRTIKRRLPVYATDEWRQALAAACADHVGLGPATLVL